MDITSVKLLENGSYFVNGNMTVPNNEEENHQAILDWIDAGNTPGPVCDLEETKANKLSELEKQYNDKTVRTVVYNENNVIVNDASLNGIQNKITLVTNDSNLSDVIWYFDDGNVTSLTLTNLKALQKKIANKDQLLRDIKHEHQQAIEVLTDVTSIDAYDVTGDSDNFSWGV